MDNLNVYGKASTGTIDYTTITSYEADTVVSGVALGFEYTFYRPEKTKDRYDLIVEHEATNWAVNGIKNLSSCTTLGLGLVKNISEIHKRKVIVGTFYFNSTEDIGPKILPTTKFGITTEEYYEFNKLIAGYLEGGIFVGDENGIMVYFGSGLNFNFINS